MKIDQFFHSIWKDRNRCALALWPLSVIYWIGAEVRRLLYSSGCLPAVRFDRPVIVVGNLTVGGSGKTPLTIWLVGFLQQRGFRPGIVSRGYGGDARGAAALVDADRDPAKFGDEPVVIARRTGAPVAVARRRVDAVNLLLREFNCDVFVADDGLQHYALRPSMTIAMVDGQERFGNGFCLPAGPLRERASRLQAFDLRLVKGESRADEWSMDLEPVKMVNLKNPAATAELSSLGMQKLAAVCAIRNSESFFSLLRDHNLDFTEHEFPDHYRFSEHDFTPLVESQRTVIMTEKDAVKCERFARSNWWFLEVSAKPASDFVAALEAKLAEYAIAPLSSQADAS